MLNLISKQTKAASTYYKNTNQKEDGFITLIVLLILILVASVALIYMRVLKANS